MLKERLHWIDIMRGMAMLFVVMQHMSAYLYYDYLYYKFITIVDIGIFFFVSGYILDKVVCLNSFYEVLIFILKKTIQLMVPFFVWGVIAKHYFFAVSPSAITFEDLISQWTAPTLWFLLTLYGYMYYFAVNKWLCTKRLKFASIIFSIGAFVMLFTLWHISGEFKLATLYFPFFAGGVLLSLFKREEMLKNSILRGLSVLAVILLTALWKSGGAIFFYVGIKYIVSASAIVILYMLITEFKWNKTIDRFFEECGKNSIAIYCIHWPFTKIFPVNIENEIYAIMASFIMGVVACMLCISFKKITNKISWLDVIMFGNTKYIKI